MSSKTLTRADLTNAIYEEVGLSQNEAANLVEMVLELISESLARGADVKITNFGTFQVRQKNARVGRNPKTGEEVPISPRRVIVFRPSANMKSRVAEDKA